MVLLGARSSRGVSDECFGSDEERVENGPAGGDWQSGSHGGDIGWDGFLELPMGQPEGHENAEHSRGGGNQVYLMQVNNPGLTALLRLL